MSTTLQPRHFRLAAFFPPSARSSLRLSSPTFVIFKDEIGGLSFFFGASAMKVPLLTVGVKGEPARAGSGEGGSGTVVTGGEGSGREYGAAEAKVELFEREVRGRF